MERQHTFHELAIEPHGIRWCDDYISAEHEARLLSIFRHDLDWPSGRKGRLSLHYGHTFDYKTFGIDPNVPYVEFPDWLLPLLPDSESRLPDQICLQYYPPGCGIPPHVDTHSAFDQLYVLSLGSPLVMQFKSGDDGRRTDVDLTPRSMVEFSGDARLHWTHGIRKRKTDPLPIGSTTITTTATADSNSSSKPTEIVRPRADRWSITYRWLRPGATCECGNVLLCDTAQRRQGIVKEKRWEAAAKAEAEVRADV